MQLGDWVASEHAAVLTRYVSSSSTTSSCSPAWMISTACFHPAAAWARSAVRSSESQVNPSPNACQSTPS